MLTCISIHHQESNKTPPEFRGVSLVKSSNILLRVNSSNHCSEIKSQSKNCLWHGIKTYGKFQDSFRCFYDNMIPYCSVVIMSPTLKGLNLFVNSSNNVYKKLLKTLSPLLAYFPCKYLYMVEITY